MPKKNKAKGKGFLKLITESGFVESPITLRHVQKFAEKAGQALHDGKQLTNGYHIIHVGVRSLSINIMYIFGTCLQSVNVKHKPYEIFISIDKSDVITGECTCKHFNGTHCRHLFAVLLYYIKQRALPLLAYSQHMYTKQFYEEAADELRDRMYRDCGIYIKKRNPNPNVTESGFVESPITFKDVTQFLQSSGQALHYGKQLIKGYHIINIGVRRFTNFIEIFATCLQSVNVKDKPYEICITIDRSYVITGECTCKSYNGTNCMHLFAVLLYYVEQCGSPILTNRHTQDYFDKAADVLRDRIHSEKARWFIRKTNGFLNLVTESGFVESPIFLKDVTQFAQSSGQALHDGKQLTKGYHIIHIGVRRVTNNFVDIFATCLQSVNVKDKPYEICISIVRTYVITGECTCQSYNGTNCMHLFAVLLCFIKQRRSPMLTDRHTQNFYDKAADELRDRMYPEKARWFIRKANGRGSNNDSQSDEDIMDNASVYSTQSDNAGSVDEATEDTPNSSERYEEKLLIALENATEKSAQTRVQALESIGETLMHCFMPDYVDERKITILDVIEKAIRRGKGDEQAWGAKLATLLAMQLGGGELIAKSLSSFLLTTAQDKSVTFNARAKCCKALALLNFLGNDDIGDIMQLMQHFEVMFSGSYLKGDFTPSTAGADAAILHSAALSSWGLLLTLIPSGDFVTLMLSQKISPSITNLMGMLQSPHLDVRMAVGETIALVLECGRSHDDGFLEEDLPDLIEATKKLATDSNKFRAKRDRKTQRATFRDVLRYLEEDISPEINIRFGIKESLILDNWALHHQYTSLCSAMGSGMNVHLAENDFLRDILQLGDKPILNDPLAPGYKQGKLVRHLINAAAFKARTLSRSKNRDKRNACFN